MRIPGALRTTPTRRLALCVALSFPVWLLGYTSAGIWPGAALTGAIALLTLLDLVRLPATASINVARSFPADAGLGDLANGFYEVDLKWSVPVLATLFDDLPPTLAAERTQTILLQPDSLTRIPVVFKPKRRGRFELGRVVLRVHGPLRLVRRSVPFCLPDAINIAPSMAVVRTYRMLALRHRLRLAGTRELRRRGEGRAFSNLREYVPGDDPRVIDWKHTARRQKLISKEFTIERGQIVIVAVDAGRMMTQIIGEASRFEAALSAALALSAVASASGDKVGLVVFDDTIRVFLQPAAGATALRMMRAALVGVEPTMTEPDYAAAFAAIARTQRSRALLVLFTDVIDPLASHELIRNATRGAARHLPVVVAMRSDQLFEAAMSPAGATKPNELFRAAAAEELLLAREEALQKMRSAGTAVIDVSPGAMPAAVVNRYLEIKARGEL